MLSVSKWNEANETWGIGSSKIQVGPYIMVHWTRANLRVISLRYVYATFETPARKVGSVFRLFSSVFVTSFLCADYVTSTYWPTAIFVCQTPWKYFTYCIYNQRQSQRLASQLCFQKRSICKLYLIISPLYIHNNNFDNKQKISMIRSILGQCYVDFKKAFDQVDNGMNNS